MRRLDDDTLGLSPSDLSDHLACPHLTTLSLGVVRGELVRPILESPHRDLIVRKGREHEAAYLARLEAEGRTIVRIPTYDGDGFDAAEARRLTEDAIRGRRADVIYQPYLTDGRWRGFADFLERVGDGYEPVDTKLARRAKPAHVLQLCFYAEQVARIQGSAVERIHVENGRGERETFRTAELGAYYRRVRDRFLAAVDSEPETYGWPCDHCSICDFQKLCRQQRVEDDHLSLVAGLRRSHAEALIEQGVTTLAALGSIDGGRRPETEIPPDTFEAIRQQAELQLRARRTGRLFWELLPDEPERGFRLMPAPDDGDVWLGPRRPPLLRDVARARVPVRLLLPRRTRRGRVRGAVGL